MKKIYLITSLLIVLCISKSEGQYFIKTISGSGTDATSGDGGPAIDAAFQYPFAISNDESGNIYVLDLLTSAVREIYAATGIIDTICGSETLRGFEGDGGLAVNAILNYPTAIATDTFGNIYIADNFNNRVREIYINTGEINTIAGTGSIGFSGDGGNPLSATFNTVLGIAVDDSGNIYLCDSYNNRIRKITASTGIISTIAGNGTAGFAGDGGPATTAEIDTPAGVAVDGSGNVYIADYNNRRIRKVNTTTGMITTIAGNGTAGYTGDGGAATSAELNGPFGICADGAGNIYVADQGESAIRKITVSTGNISTMAGTGTPGYSGDGGPSTSARINYATGVCVNKAGSIITIADKLNHRVRAIYDPADDAIPAIPGSKNTIFPNPATNELTIQSTNQPINQISISSLLGETIYTNKYNAQQVRIDVSGFATGIYFIKINGSEVQKFVKE